jgi:hypothetical protein
MDIICLFEHEYNICFLIQDLPKIQKNNFTVRIRSAAARRTLHAKTFSEPIELQHFREISP